MRLGEGRYFRKLLGIIGQVKPGAVHFSCSQPIMLSEEEKSSSG